MVIGQRLLKIARYPEISPTLRGYPRATTPKAEYASFWGAQLGFWRSVINYVIQETVVHPL
jgi:hypothetical protein